MAKSAQTNERNSIRPTHVTESGALYGAGAKTVIASQAFAKITRLVPNQEWEHITELFSQLHEYYPDPVIPKKFTTLRS
jgi:hypothetical protein